MSNAVSLEAVADDHCTERIARRIAANHELLRLVDLVFEPGTAALDGLATGVFTLGDDALKSELLYQRDQLGWRCKANRTSLLEECEFLNLRLYR